jgi:hypothetical protein
MISTNDISTPLLGNLPQHEYDERDSEYDEEEGCILRSIKIAYDDTEESEDDLQSSSHDEESFFLSFALHVLLFAQFGMTFSASSIEAITGLSWSVVNYSIILYVITTTIYRQAAKDCKLTCSAVVLILPEILMNIMVVLVLFQKVVAAFLVLWVSTLCLAFLVMASSIRVLVVTKSVTDESECDDDLQQPQDELDVSYFKGGRVRSMRTE